MDEKKQNTEVSIGPTPDAPTTEPIKSRPHVSHKIIISFLAVFGVLSLGGIIFILLRPTAPPQPPLEVSQPSPSPVPSLTLELSSPTDGELAVNSEILVTGRTLANTTVVIFTENDETSIESNDIGSFEGTISLADGINSLIITAYGEDGEEKTVTLDIVYDREA